MENVRAMARPSSLGRSLHQQFERARPSFNLASSDSQWLASMGCLEGNGSEIGPNVTCRSYFPSREMTHHAAASIFTCPPIPVSRAHLASCSYQARSDGRFGLTSDGVAEVTEEIEMKLALKRRTRQPISELERGQTIYFLHRTDRWVPRGERVRQKLKKKRNTEDFWTWVSGLHIVMVLLDLRFRGGLVSDLDV